MISRAWSCSGLRCVTMRFNPPPNWPTPPPGWRPGPGGKPDPAWDPPPPGWNIWVDESPDAEGAHPSGAAGKAGERRRREPVAGAPERKSHPLRLIVFLFVGLVLLAVWQGGKLTVVNLGGENGVSAEFAPKADAVKQQQPELEDRLNRIESELQNRRSAEPSAIDVSGTWLADNGYNYVFQQYGDAVAFSEESIYGVTATGQGRIDGNRLKITFQAWNLSVGTSELVLNPDGSLTGTVTNTAQGFSFPIQMFRNQ